MPKRKLNEEVNTAEIEKLLDQSYLLELNSFVDAYEDDYDYEDDYEDGEGQNVNSWEVDSFSKNYNSLDELANNIKKDLAEYLTKESYEDIKESYIDIDDDERVHYSVLTNADNSPATEREKEEWKNGNQKLYSNQYSITVSINGTEIPAHLFV